MKLRCLTAMAFFAFLSAPAQAQIVAPQSHAPHHWTYSGEDGPEHWGALDPANSACATGKSQSPINIKLTTSAPLAPIDFDYKPGPWQVVNNGHTVQVILPFGSSIAIGGHRYELVQFHFHHPSEEAIADKHFDMVIHLVHKDSEGNLAVVAVLIAAGNANPVVQKLWDNLSAQEGRIANIPGDLNPAALLPAEQSYYTFSGSLTTPPCSEGVRWFVLKTPMNISAEQERMFAFLYPGNARPLQSMNGRVVVDGSK
jgi:carbonic anhydrase